MHLDSLDDVLVDRSNSCVPQLIPRSRTVPKCRQPAGVASGWTPLRTGRGLGSPAGRVSAFGLPAVLRTAGRRLLLDRSHLTRPESIQIWTTSFPVYDERRGRFKTPQGISAQRGHGVREPVQPRRCITIATLRAVTHGRCSTCPQPSLT